MTTEEHIKDWMEKKKRKHCLNIHELCDLIDSRYVGIDIGEKKSQAKLFIDANMFDGEDRSGCTGDRTYFNPDELQKFMEEIIDDLFPDVKRYCNDK